MNTIDNATSPQPPLPGPRSAKGSSATARRFAVVAVLTCGLALGAGSLALGVGSLAAAAQESGHSAWTAGLRLAFVQHAVGFMLDSVGATSEQESKAHDIIAANLADIAPDPKEREAFRKQALDLLGAPSIDRAAVEKLRAEVIARFDAKSKKIVDSLLAIEDELTPAQRAALSARIEGFAQHGPMGGPWGGPMGGWGGPHWGPPMGDRTPDNSTDKD
jgi:Spy/CpxP family protein refolding chaperone